MAAAITDLIDRVTDSTTSRPVIASLAAPGKALAASSININDATGWTTTTAIHFAIYQTVTVGGVTVKDPTTQTDWKGVLAGTTINNLTLTGGTDRTYTAGAIVELTPTARWAKDLYEVIRAHANQDGTLIPQAVRDALAIGATSADGWDVLPYTLSVVSGYNKGQREFDLTIANADASTVLWPGMRLRFDRSTSAPTQSADFESTSSQYTSRASGSVAGFSFTDDYTLEATIEAESYQTNAAIISRYDGTNGFMLRLSNGRVVISGFNGGNFREWVSTRAVELGRKTHIAASLDMSGTTGTIYIDGVAVPGILQSSGTPSALVQGGGNLVIGGYAAGLFPFDGRISDVRVWSTIRTALQIRDNQYQLLTGSETGLVGAWTLNGVWTDLTSNANTLTPVNGATPTYADNLLHNREYAIVQKVVYSAPNTTVTVFTGSYSTVPNMVLNTPFYSKERIPYGFPAGDSDWMLSAPLKSNVSTPIPATLTWYPTAHVLTVPTGKWRVINQGAYSQTNSVNGLTQATFRLNSLNNGILPNSIPYFFNNTVSSAGFIFPINTMSPLTATSQEQLTVEAYLGAGAGTMAAEIRGDVADAALQVINMYV